MEFLMVAECLFENTWKVLTGIEYPGTGITVGAILIGTFIIGLSIIVFKKILGGRK